MITQILTKTPIWVWPLLAILLVLGIRASKERWVPAFVMYFMPLLGFLSLSNMLDLPNQSLVWGLYGAFYALGLAFGHFLQRGWTIARAGKRVKLAGEWMTLASTMTIFLASFLNGMLASIMPSIIALPAVYMGLIVLKAAVSGFFVGRAIYIFRYMNAPQALGERETSRSAH